ncbi:hypothetical protein GTQ40_07375 [Flavobacteriaceae bacterium R38]|nr:hypothetical protein [Flavobacteriaceae bacterium R38]
MNDSIKKEHVFQHPIDKVWDAISIEKEISSWFIKADFKAEKGYYYTFNSEGEHCTQINGVIVEADPYTLIYTWIVEGTKAETTVKWTLEEVEEGTKLYLEHSGISEYEGDTAVDMFNSFNNGWNNCINKLTEYLKAVYAG